MWIKRTGCELAQMLKEKKKTKQIARDQRRVTRMERDYRLLRDERQNEFSSAFFRKRKRKRGRKKGRDCE